MPRININTIKRERDLYQRLFIYTCMDLFTSFKNILPEGTNDEDISEAMIISLLSKDDVFNQLSKDEQQQFIDYSMSMKATLQDKIDKSLIL